MHNLLKKSMIVSSVLSSVPLVNAQTEEVVSAVGGALGMAFGLIGGIIQVILDLFQKSPLYAKIFIAVFMGIFFYNVLKTIPALKDNSKAAGMIAVAISLITALAIPDAITSNVFSTKSPFIVFIICAFLLIIFRHESRVARAIKGIAYTALMVEFAVLAVKFEGTIQLIISGFVVLTLILMIYNFMKIGSGVGPTGGGLWDFLTKERHVMPHVRKALPTLFGPKKTTNQTTTTTPGNQPPANQPKVPGNQPVKPQVNPQQVQQAVNKVQNQAKTVAVNTQNLLKLVQQLKAANP